MAKRVAVLVRERREEGLRVAVGLTLADNQVDVCLVDCAAPGTPPAADYIDALRQMDASVAAACEPNPGLEALTVAELARRILLADHILAY